ncbi:unnamed protein product, partial [Amoebophrya sp. A25]
EARLLVLPDEVTSFIADVVAAQMSPQMSSSPGRTPTVLDEIEVPESGCETLTEALNAAFRAVFLLTKEQHEGGAIGPIGRGGADHVLAVTTVSGLEVHKYNDYLRTVVLKREQAAFTKMRTFHNYHEGRGVEGAMPMGGAYRGSQPAVVLPPPITIGYIFGGETEPAAQWSRRACGISTQEDFKQSVGRVLSIVAGASDAVSLLRSMTEIHERAGRQRHITDASEGVRELVTLHQNQIFLDELDEAKNTVNADLGVGVGDVVVGDRHAIVFPPPILRMGEKGVGEQVSDRSMFEEQNSQIRQATALLRKDGATLSKA